MPPLAVAHMARWQGSMDCPITWPITHTHTHMCTHTHTCLRRLRHLVPAWDSPHLRPHRPCPRLVLCPNSSPVPPSDLGQHTARLDSHPAVSLLPVGIKGPGHPPRPRQRSAMQSNNNTPRPAMHLIEMATSICFWGCLRTFALDGVGGLGLVSGLAQAPPAAHKASTPSRSGQGDRC